MRANFEVVLKHMTECRKISTSRFTPTWNLVKCVMLLAYMVMLLSHGYKMKLCLFKLFSQKAGIKWECDLFNGRPKVTRRYYPFNIDGHRFGTKIHRCHAYRIRYRIQCMHAISYTHTISYTIRTCNIESPYNILLVLIWDKLFACEGRVVK